MIRSSARSRWCHNQEWASSALGHVVAWPRPPRTPEDFTWQPYIRGALSLSINICPTDVHIQNFIPVIFCGSRQQSAEAFRRRSSRKELKPNIDLELLRDQPRAVVRLDGVALTDVDPARADWALVVTR